MKTPVAYCKILKTQKWTKVNLTDIQEVDSNNRLCPFDEATYKKSNKYVIKDTDNNKYLVICVVEFADSDTELNSKIFDDDGNLKRFAPSKRLSLGPTELESSDLDGCEINASKVERAMLNVMKKKKDAEESDNILQVMNTKSSTKRKDGKLKKNSDLNVGETKKAAVEEDRKILKMVSKVNVSPKKRIMSGKEGPSPKKKKNTKADGSQREAQQGSTDNEVERHQQTEEEKQQNTEEEKQRKTEEKQRKIQEEKQRKTEEEKQRKTEEEKQRKKEEEKQRKKEEEKQHKIQAEKQQKIQDEKQQKQDKEQKKAEEVSVKGTAQDFNGELNMALLALHKCDERYAVLLDNFNSIKKELGELKDAVSSGTPQVMSKKETCKLRHLKDVNPETDLEYTIPDGMVHIGGGKCINLVQVAKLEKLDDLRGRLAGLCRLYWPGKELNEWSLSGKTKHKITNDYSAGMAEILRCMHWRKKANLEHSNVHRTLSRVISELHNKKGPNKSYWQKSPVKEKIRDITEQSNEDKQDEDGEDSSQEKQNESSGSESDDGGKSNHTGSDSDSE